MPHNPTPEELADLKAVFDAKIKTDTVALDLSAKVRDDVLASIMQNTETAAMGSPLPRSILMTMMATSALHAAQKAFAEVMVVIGDVPSREVLRDHMIVLLDKTLSGIPDGDFKGDER